DEEAGGQPSGCHRRGEELGSTGDDLLGGLDPGGDLLGRADRAARDARQGERGPHHLQEGPPALRVGQFGRVLGELAVEEMLERLRPGQLLQAPPVSRAGPRLGELGADLHQVVAGILSWRSHRWQIEQLSSRSTSILYSSTSFFPSATRSVWSSAPILLPPPSSSTSF